MTALSIMNPATERVPSAPESHDSLKHLRHVIDHAAHLLPAQGPITVFIHHNTLHAFEDLPFTQAVKKAARVFGCQPFLTEERYREALGRGRIRFSDLEQILHEQLADGAEERIAKLGTRRELRLALLQYPVRSGPNEELHWFVAETDALRRIRSDASAAVRGRLIAETRRWVLRDLRCGLESVRNGHAAPLKNDRPQRVVELLNRFADTEIENWTEATWEAFVVQALWRVCCDGVGAATPPDRPPVPVVRHRDLLLQAAGVDSDPRVHELMIRLCAAFLDQGFAPWPLPNRELGFFEAFSRLYGQPQGPPDRWLRGLDRELARIRNARISPLESIRESLTLLGVAENTWDEYIAATFLALRGWGGMVREVEARSDRVAHPIPNGSVVEFLAVRLLLDRFSLAYTARQALGFTGPLTGLRAAVQRSLPDQDPPSVEQRAFQVFQLAQVLGWTPQTLHGLTPQEWDRLLGEIESFTALDRREVFHLAYELRFRNQTLDALALHVPHVQEPPRPARYQVITCLDEREESFRRHLEEIAPDVETFGAAGFFAVAMYYRGAADAHYVPLCPIVIRPQHWIEEQVDETAEDAHRRRARARKAIGAVSHRFHLGSRTAATGALLTAGVGVLASVPLVARILFPRLTARIRRIIGRVVQTPPATRLKLERREPTPGPENGKIGYNLDELTNIADRLLKDIGLVSNFSRLILALGHGSSSLNNPHKSAYDCGACGGSPGAPNGRAIAEILNDPRVRARLAERGVVIPPETWVVGGYHNTCNDTVTLFDLDRVPEGHRVELDKARRELDHTCERNAHERCRRFMSAPLTLSFAAARQHVEARSEDLAQTRPELGHATNALCFVGRRKWTRGLFFDRRMFVTAYDPTIDDENAAILTRTLGAVFPVCGGINLEYYFSHVDSPGYGCGTKLPHNVTSLLGVMDGAASDLRTGLPWQMTEIHEPVRLLIVCEIKAEKMLGVLQRNPPLGSMARNGWVQLAVMDPDTAELLHYRDGAFHHYEPQADQLPKAASSADWYRGWRDHLEFAEVGT